MRNYYSALSNTDRTGWLMIGVIGLVLVISPVIGFFLSLICFRQKISLVFFVLFSFYFGWFYEPQMDLLVHYNHFRTLIGKSLLEVWTAPGTKHLGKELYPVLFKYIVGSISTNPHFFSACACMVYASLFVYGVLGSIRDLYIQKMILPAWIFFFAIIFTVEYNWFLGFRFWSGVFVFVAFYIRYTRTGENKYLYLSFLCLCFHFSLLGLCAAAFLNYVLKENFKVRYILVAISWIVRYMQIPIIEYIGKIEGMEGIVKNVARNEAIVRSVAKRIEFIRNTGNYFYLIRNDVLFLSACVTLFFLWKSFGKRCLQYNNFLFGLVLILYALTNMGYVDLIFYDRFYKLTLLLLSIYLFQYIMHIQNEISVKLQFWLVIFPSLSLLYAIATITISQREYLWKIELWFNNLFL